MYATPDESTVFEQGKVLSESLLWSWISDYYAKGGLAVWSDGDIPFHITNTPILGQSWARSVFTLCRDFHRFGVLDVDSPIEVYELGPGTGRHAFFLLKELNRLERLSKAFAGKELRFRVHLGELGMAGLESLSEHPNLKEAIKTGDLVLHQFDISNQETPRQCFPPTDKVFEPASAKIK